MAPCQAEPKRRLVVSLGSTKVTLVSHFVGPALSEAEHSVDVERYLQFFEVAVDLETPPYFLSSYGDSFRRHVENPTWVIQSLISNAIKEGEGSRDLAAVADGCEDIGLSSDLAVHIGDEARHCRMYLQLIEHVFPNALPDELRVKLTDRFPPLTYQAVEVQKQSNWKMLDYLIQINLGEVRTRIHQKLMQPVLEAYCPRENQDMLCKTSCRLADDECCHICYTASRIGALSREFDHEKVQLLFDTRVHDFSAYTERELGHQRFGLFAAPLIRER
jgi:hypothetical protein